MAHSHLSTDRRGLGSESFVFRVVSLIWFKNKKATKNPNQNNPPPKKPKQKLKQKNTLPSLIKKEMEEQVIEKSLQNRHWRPRAYVLNSVLQAWRGLPSKGLNFHLVLGGHECKLFKTTAHPASTSL